jgi:pilus assembly protein FimV
VLGPERGADADHGAYAEVFPREQPITAETESTAIEEALLDRVAMEPDRLDAHLALLRHYHERKDAAKFEEAARGLRARIASEDQPEWREAAKLAATLVPSSPLFASQPAADLRSETELEAAPPAAEDDARQFDLSTFEDQQAVEPAPPVVEAPAPVVAPEPPTQDFDFDFDLEQPTQTVETVQPAVAEAPAASDEVVFNFDFGDLSPTEPASPAATAAAEPVAAPAAEPFTIDLPEIDIGSLEVPEREPAAPAAPVAAAPPARVVEAPALDDDLGLGDLGLMGEDAVATKLDLARAYMDMGDPDGARSMLEEVIAEGNEAQKGEARRLLTELR